MASWFVSPVMSGLMSTALYYLIRRFILQTPKPLNPGLRSLPFFYGITILINVFSVVHDGPKCKFMKLIILIVYFLSSFRNDLFIKNFSVTPS